MATKVKYFAYSEAVFGSNLNAHAKLVLLAIADFYNWNKNSPAYPSFPTLAKKTGLSINTVRSYVKTLQDQGWLQFAGFKYIDNIKLNMWKPTIPPHQNTQATHANFDFTPTNWEADFGVKQISNIEVYKQRKLNKEEKIYKKQGFALLNKLKVKNK